jgi:hypothetical protein
MAGATPLDGAFLATMGVPLETYTAIVDTAEQGPCITVTDPDAANGSSTTTAAPRIRPGPGSI